MKLSKTQIRDLTNARTIGGTPSVYVTTGELAFLLYLVCTDLEVAVPNQLESAKDVTWANYSFYDIPILQVKCEVFDEDESHEEVLQNILSQLIEIDVDIFTYFLALISLHAQRRKYRKILDRQPIPDLETIIPRGLLELGGLRPDLLASWLVWRKFIYDIDNRAAQTTGYLFEPILSLAIGGIPYSAAKSPIRRKENKKGRQVDCVVNKDAYEFKMRVTIAASGQGRFGEELSFARDCAASGYRPILLVLDPTPSTKLEELSNEYRKQNGEAFIGDDAWSHLRKRAGTVMSVFLERYVRAPLSQIDSAFTELPPLLLEYDDNTGEIYFKIDQEQSKLR